MSGLQWELLSFFLRSNVRGVTVSGLQWEMLSAEPVRDGALCVARGRRGLYTLHRRSCALAVPRGRGPRWWVTITPARGPQRGMPLPLGTHREFALMREAKKHARDWDAMVTA